MRRPNRQLPASSTAAAGSAWATSRPEKREGHAVNKKGLIEGGALLIAGLVGMGDGLRLVYFKNAHSVEDLTGPGRYLFLISLFLALNGAIYLWAQYRQSAVSGQVVEKSNDSRRKVATILLILAVYIFFVDKVGYLVSTSMFFVVLLKSIGQESWLRAIFISIMMTVVFYIVFIRMAGMIFPRGALLF
jgi:hypothetical protein